ncbi:MAG: hypothetical protein V7785_11510 [Bermanella sp.]
MKIILTCGFILLMVMSQVQAHELKENSAQVIMRDGQVEIRLMVNMARWQSLLQSDQAWLMGDSIQVMPKHLNDKQKSLFLSELITQNSQVSVNDVPVKMGILYFPDSIDINNDHHSNEYNEIVLTAQHKQGHVNNISLSLPKSLGNVHSRFVQPRYRLIKAGNQTQVSFKHTFIKEHKMPSPPINNITIHQPISDI